MHDLTFSTDHSLHISSWGKQISDFTGRSADSVVGMLYSEVLPPFVVNGKDALGESARTQKRMELKDYGINCLASRITADITISPRVSPRNEVEGLDVTVVPTSACALASKLTRSEQLIKIGQIASSLAHGVRNPLNAIKGAVVYLNSKYAHDPSLIEFTKIMEEEISRLETFISRFLSSSVPDADPSSVNVNALLNRIEALTALQFRARNITTLYELGDVPPITATTFHVEQSVLNIINNAIEAMDGGGRLSVKTYATDRGNEPFVVIEISDTGPGMSDVKRNTIPPSTKGTDHGYGLFITCEIMKHYQGHLDIDSVKGRGTTVRMSFPACRAKEGAPC